MIIENPPTVFSVTHYNRKITIELDHSDLDMEELMSIFKALAIGMTFSEEQWNQYVPE